MNGGSGVSIGGVRSLRVGSLGKYPMIRRVSKNHVRCLGCLIGILIIAYYDPITAVVFHPL